MKSLVNPGVRSFGIFRNKNSGYSAPGSRIAGMEIQVFRNENSSRTNAYLHYSNYFYSGLIPNERAPGKERKDLLQVLIVKMLYLQLKKFPMSIRIAASCDTNLYRKLCEEEDFCLLAMKFTCYCDKFHDLYLLCCTEHGTKRNHIILKIMIAIYFL